MPFLKTLLIKWRIKHFAVVLSYFIYNCLLYDFCQMRLTTKGLVFAITLKDWRFWTYYQSTVAEVLKNMIII